MSKLFQKAKLAVKFRRAGEGHSLSESSSSRSNQPQQRQESRKEPTSDAQKAGQAALARFSQQEKTPRRPQSATATWKSSGSSSSEAGQDIAKLRNEVKAEIGRDMIASDLMARGSNETEVIRQDSAPVLAVSGVFFKCPFCLSSFLRQEINGHMEECLTKSLAEDQVLTPVNMIRSLNKDETKVKSCVDVLCRYLDNIVQNPDEEKYRRIKKSNKVYQGRVNQIKGATEFLLSCGFVEKPLSEDDDEKCFILEEGTAEVFEKLTVMKEVLLGTERCKPSLDRSLKIFRPTSDEQTLELPDDFFDLSSDEVKKMQNERTEDLERNTQLRTRAMREKDEKNPTRIYRFTLLRIRFPDHLILQAIFNAREKASSLISFVREQLECDWLPFVLAESGGQQLTEEDCSFAELGLVPAAILNFVCDASIIEDIKASNPSQSSLYLKSELLEKFGCVDLS